MEKNTVLENKASERRKQDRKEYEANIRIHQEGKVLYAEGVDLSTGGISFFSDSVPSRFTSLDVVIVSGAIAIPGALRNAKQDEEGRYRVSVAFDSPQPGVYTVLTGQAQ